MQALEKKDEVESKRGNRVDRQIDGGAKKQTDRQTYRPSGNEGKGEAQCKNESVYSLEYVSYALGEYIHFHAHAMLTGGKARKISKLKEGTHKVQRADNSLLKRREREKWRDVEILSKAGVETANSNVYDKARKRNCVNSVHIICRVTVNPCGRSGVKCESGILKIA